MSRSMFSSKTSYKIFWFWLIIFNSLALFCEAATVTGGQYYNHHMKKVNDSIDKTFELVVLHSNDMHGRFDETDKYTNQCEQEDKQANHCYGGFARLANVIRKYRKKSATGGPASLFLNAGDTYTGTPRFSLYKENISTEFMNVLAPDAMALGNHEFDYGLDRLIPHLKNSNFPIVAANMEYDHVPEMKNISNLRKSIVLEIRGVKVGIVGYITQETQVLSLEEKVRFTDEVDAINKESAALTDDGVKIIIALGHSGIEKDLEIAEHCPLVDLVVGGHSHTYIGDKIDLEDPYGPYPMIRKQISGKKVPVIQAYAFTKYIGYFKGTFNENGDLIQYNGRPILLDSKVEKEPDVVELLEKYRVAVDELGRIQLGETRVLLDGHSCRFKECNLGNLITDAMVYQYAHRYHTTTPSTKYWSDVGIGLIQSGGIRASIDGETYITKLHINTVLPFGDRLVTEYLTGEEIRQVLEWSVHRYGPQARNGEFLQVSGLKIRYNVSQPAGERVTYVEAKCASCVIPEYYAIEHNATYKVIMNEYLYRGGDGFNSLRKKPGANLTDVVDIDNIIAYITRKKIIYTEKESRIVFDPSSEQECDHPDCVSQQKSGVQSFKTSVQALIVSLSLVILLRNI